MRYTEFEIIKFTVGFIGYKDLFILISYTRSCWLQLWIILDSIDIEIDNNFREEKIGNTYVSTGFKLELFFFSDF